MFLSTLAMAALLGAARAQLLLPADPFVLADQCDAIGAAAADATCVTDLVNTQIGAIELDAEAAATTAFSDVQTDFETRETTANGPLQQAIAALNADPTSHALINWCKNEVEKIGVAANVGRTELNNCKNICAQVKRGRDTAEAFTCIEDEINKRVIDLQSDNNGDQAALEGAQNQQVTQAAFFAATLDAEENDQFDGQVFGQGRADVEVAQEKAQQVQLALNEARALIESDPASDAGVFAQAFFEATVPDVNAKAQLNAIDEELGLTGLFETLAAVPLQLAAPEPRIVLTTVSAIPDDQIDALVTDPVTALFGDLAVTGVLATKKRQAEVDVTVAVASDSDLAQQVGELVMARFCVDSSLTCAVSDIVTPEELAEAKIVDPVIEEPAPAPQATTTTAWKQTTTKKKSSGYGNNNNDESDEAEEEEEEEDAAVGLSLSLAALAAAAARLF